MATYQNLIVENRGSVMVITLNRPQALNALNRSVLQELSSVFTSLETDESVRAVIITGSGAKAFAAGADIAEIAALSREDALHFSQFGQNVFNQIEQFTRPVLAAVNGFALGGGCELAMACHLRVASDNAKFGQPEVNLGLIAGYGGTQRLPKLIGRTKATELLLTGDMMNAEEAKQLGLVNAVYPQAELLDKSLALLEKILTKAPLAIGYTLAAIHDAFNYDKNGYQTEAVNFARACASEDAKEGTTAFLEKRQPRFTKK